MCSQKTNDQDLAMNLGQDPTSIYNLALICL